MKKDIFNLSTGAVDNFVDKGGAEALSARRYLIGIKLSEN
jgi:hypothetical protein